MAFTEQERADLTAQAAEIIARYPKSRSALLPLLHLVQATEGFVSTDGIAFCAGQLGLSEAEVTAVVSFYTMYKRRPVGEYHVGVCTNTLCAIMGGDAIHAELRAHLGIEADEATADGKLSLERIECNAACDYAPVVLVNWEFFDDQTPESARELVDGLRAGEDIVPSRGAPGWSPGGRRPGSWPASPMTRPPPGTPLASRPWPACASPRRTAGRRTSPCCRWPTTEGGHDVSAIERGLTGRGLVEHRADAGAHGPLGRA